MEGSWSGQPRLGKFEASVTVGNRGGWYTAQVQLCDWSCPNRLNLSPDRSVFCSSYNLALFRSMVNLYSEGSSPFWTVNPNFFPKATM